MMTSPQTAPGLEAIRESMTQAGHDPHPAHRLEEYGRDFRIVCRSCGARCDAHVGLEGDVELVDDGATAINCKEGR